MPRITLQIRGSKSSELGPAAAEQIFSAIPDTPKKHLFASKEPIAFEIISINQTTYFQVNLPETNAQYLKSQIHAAYPEAMINPAPQETFNFPGFFAGSVASTTLKLTHGSFYPLRTHKVFSETDPLSTTLGILAKLPPGQAVLIQILVANAPESWKRQGFLLAAGSVDSQGKVTPHSYKTQIETKLAQICHRVAIKIATSTPDQATSQALLSSVAQTFAAITSAEGNSLTSSSPLFRKHALTDSLQYRDFTATTKQFLSIEELATLFHLPNKTLKDIKNIAWGRNLLGEPPETLPTFDSTPEELRNNVNLFASTEYKNESKIFGIKDVDRRRHIYVMGKTGTGKSTLLANMAINDLKHGKGMAIIDPHGDLVETILNYIPSNRINDVVYLNPADTEFTVKLNLLEATGAEHKELVASGIIAIFQKLYGFSWGPRLEHILRNTLLTLITRDQSTLEDVVKILTNQKFRQRVVQDLQDPVLRNFWEGEFAGMGDRLRAEAVSPILNKVGQFVSSPLIRNVINTPTNSFSIQEVMDQGKILLCNLSQGKLGEDNSALLGAMLITKIQLTSMSRVYIPEEQRRDFYLYVDEFQNFATTSFIKILSEARKYRLNLVLANQYIDQIDEDVRKAIFGNCATIATFIVGAQDAGLLALEFGNQYEPEQLVQLEKHQIILKLSIDNMTSPSFPAYTLPLASSSNQNKDKVIKVSQERYARKRPSSHLDTFLTRKSTESLGDTPTKPATPATKSDNSSSQPSEPSPDQHLTPKDPNLTSQKPDHPPTRPPSSKPPTPKPLEPIKFDKPESTPTE